MPTEKNFPVAIIPPSNAEHQVRPTNIPPPSIVLALFPPLLEHLQQKAAKYISSAKGLSEPIPPDPNLAHHISRNLRVMARVVTGRTLRWKRDPILRQSTKIGPARSGKPGGMKLSSVNKNETIKEEQEAVEVLKAWRSRGGLLSAVISAAGLKPIPIPTGNMKIRTGTADEGILKASHACALCGLKREERIAEVDRGVNDSFREWWVDHWGHTDCQRFWEENSSSLAHR